MAERQDPTAALGLFDCIDDAVLTTDEQFLVTSWNKAAERLLGIAAEEAIGAPLVDLVRLDLAEADQQAVQATITEAGRWSGEVAHLEANGARRWLDWSVNRFRMPGSGEGAFVAIARDITAHKRLDAALQRSEARLRAFLEHSPIGLGILDLDLRYLAVNEALAALNGMTVQEHLGKTAREVLGDAIEMIEPLLAEVIASREPRLGLELSVELPDKPGEIHVLSGGYFPILADDGSVSAFGAVVIDITERKATESELRRREAELRRILEATTDGIWTWNFETDELFFSERYYAMLGYEPSAFPASFDAWRDLLHPDDLEAALGVAGEYLETKPDIYHNEFRLRAADGQYRWIRARARVVERDAQGEPVLMVGNHEDVTETRRAAEEIRAERDRMRALLDASPYPILVTDLDGTITACNPATLVLLGLESRDQVIGRSGFDLLTPVDRSRAHDFRRQVPDSGIYRDLEFQVVRTDGSVRQVETSVSLVRGPDARPQGFVAVVVDVTERRQAEEERESLQEQLLQAQKMEAIGTLAGGVAHDMNNLLGGIMGFASLLGRAMQPDDLRLHDVEEILAICRQARDLTSNLLGYARKGMYRREPIDLNAAVMQVEEILKRTISKKIIIETRLADETPVVQGDPTQISQILLNLCINAAQAMPGKGTLTIATGHRTLEPGGHNPYPALEPGRYAEVSVIDTGAGMDRDTLEHAFEPFFTTKQRGEGTGLGLSMVYGAVKNHGGAVALDSAPGRGTTATIVLPQAEPGEEVAVPAERPARAPRGNETVLIVDDEEVIRITAARMLQTFGYNQMLAGDGEEAVATYEQHRDRIDLVILDLSMPEMDGEETFSRLQEIDPEIRVLLFSGHSVEDAASRLLSRGAVGYLQKPFDAGMLAEAVTRALALPAPVRS